MNVTMPITKHNLISSHLLFVTLTVLCSIILPSLVMYGRLPAIYIFIILSIFYSSRSNGDVVNEWKICSSDDRGSLSSLVESLHASIATAECQLASPSDYPPDYYAGDDEEFDFIVVGAGSAGSVVANRLTEVNDWRVLLVEAGGDPTKTSEVPAFRGKLAKTQIDWQYQTDPEENSCLGMNGHRCHWTRGKVLGGSSTINYLNYLRGNAKEFDAWEAAGNLGWGYEDVLPYFKKSEDMRAREVLDTLDFMRYHGEGGHLKVETYVRDDYTKEIGDILRDGMEEMGYHYNSDCNGKTQLGFSPIQGTMENGQRCSTAKAFLSPAKGRNNLKVSKYSLAVKLLIDPSSSRVYGIEITDGNGNVNTVRARKEVILSAGAINSPQLLMLSGIGPKQHLESLNITVIADLPVGKNLQDHTFMPGIAISLNYSNTQEEPEQSMYDFLMNKSSPLSNSGISYVGLINTLKNADIADVELLFADFRKNDTSSISGYSDAVGYENEIKSEFIKINSKSFILLALLVNLQPLSRGEILLKNTNPLNYPIIKSGYFTDDRDFDIYLRAYDFMEKLAQTNSFKLFNAEFQEIEVPACSQFTLRSRKYRECALRHLAHSTYHYCGTCKMGPPSSTESVVDPQLRVKGVQGLRVIDASIIPTIVGGHLNAASIMIGEKGSDLIKDTWLVKRCE